MMISGEHKRSLVRLPGAYQNEGWMLFTRQSVAEIAIPAGKPYHIEWDETLPGFGVRINPTNKVWVVQYRAAGKSRRETIGRVNTIPLDEARKIARATLAKVQLGGDPQAE